MKKLACLTSLLFLSTAIAFASSAIDGGWAGEIGAGDATQTIQMSLRVDDSRLSGSVLSPGQEMSIQDGTFDGTKLKFKAVDVTGDENAVTINCAGSYAGDAITFACSTPQGDTRVFTVNRLKP